MLFKFYNAGNYNQEFGKSLPFFINNFGYYRDVEKEISVNRPNGRKDFQLIFVYKGKLLVGNKILTEGQSYIFYPEDPQIYKYLPSENSKYYWIHFTGNQTLELLKKYDLHKGVIDANGLHEEINSLFSIINRAESKSNIEIPRFVVSIFKSILILIGTSKIEKKHFSRAEKILKDVNSTMTIDKIAEIYNLTTEHFIRLFKSYYGMTPTNYKITSRINQAKILLIETQLSTSDIAELCGYNDPLYFSRLFKKYVGTSPSVYRKQMSF